MTLPEEINLGSPERAEEYAAASYQCADGAVYRGAPIAYTATPLRAAPHPEAAEAFLKFLQSDAAAEAAARHGLKPARWEVRRR